MMPDPSVDANEPSQKPPIESDKKAVDNIDNSPPSVPVATMPNPSADENEPSQKPPIEPDTKAVHNHLPKYDSDDEDVKPSARKPD